MKFIVAAIATTYTCNAALQCKMNNYKDVIENMALGFSSDPTNKESDCFKSATNLSDQV